MRFDAMRCGAVGRKKQPYRVGGTVRTRYGVFNTHNHNHARGRPASTRQNPRYSKEFEAEPISACAVPIDVAPHVKSRGVRTDSGSSATRRLNRDACTYEGTFRISWPSEMRRIVSVGPAGRSPRASTEFSTAKRRPPSCEPLSRVGFLEAGLGLIRTRHPVDGSHS